MSRLRGNEGLKSSVPTIPIRVRLICQMLGSTRNLACQPAKFGLVRLRQLHRLMWILVGDSEFTNGDTMRWYAQVMRTHARTFFFASLFLPPSLRYQIAVLYTFFRTLDDLVDEAPAAQHSEVRAELLAWHRWFGSVRPGAAPREPLGSDLAALIASYRLDPGYFIDFLEGLFIDLDQRPIADAAALLRYCYCVASTVGLAMAPMLGVTSSSALRAARDLGIAMQLTNIIRDVGQDLQRGRLYLPLDDLRRFNCSPEYLYSLLAAGRGPDERFRMLMQFEIIRADTYYERAAKGIDFLPLETQIGIRTAAHAYRRILRQVERNDYDTLRLRATTTIDQKVFDFGRALWASLAVTPSLSGEGS